MGIPTASINDLINTAQSSNPSISPGGGDPVSNFIKMLGNYALQGANSIGKSVGNQPLADPNSLVSKVLGRTPTVSDADSLANNVMSANWDPNPNSQYSITQPNVAPILQGKSTSLGGAAADTIGMAMMGHLAATHGGEPTSALDAEQAVNPAEINGNSIAPSGFTPSPEALVNAEPFKSIIDSGAGVGNSTPGKGDFVNPPSEMVINQGAPAQPDNGGPLFPPSSLPQQPSETPPSQPENPVKPFPNVPDEPAMVTDRQGTHPVTGGNPVRLDFSNQSAKNSYYLADQQHAQDVINKYVPGDTALEVQKNLPIQLTEETQRIKNMMASNPTASASVDDLIKENEQALKNKGIAPGVSSKADTATREALNKFDSLISTKAGVTGKTTVTGDDLLNYKNILDDQLQSAYKKADNGGTLTPAENAMRTLRTTINNQLKTMYPGMGGALDRQSGMLDAQPYVAKAASTEMGQQYKEATAPQTPAPTLFQKAGNVLKNPLVDLGLGAVGLKATQGLPNVIGGGLAALKQVNTPNTSLPSTPPTTPANSVIPSSYNPLQSGAGTPVVNPLQTGEIQSLGDFTNSQAALKSKIDTESFNDPQSAATDQATYDSNQIIRAGQSGLIDASSNQMKAALASQTAMADLKTASPSLMNAINQGYDSMMASSNKDYARLGGDLKTLSTIAGYDITKAKTPEALTGAIQAILNDQANNLQQQKQIYGKVKSPSISSPSVSSSFPQGIKIGGGNIPSLQGLPSIGALPQ